MSYQPSNKYYQTEFYEPQLMKEFELIEYCHRSIESFYNEGDVTVTPDGVYIYREEPKNKVLAVAHLDTVQDTKSYSRTSTQLYVPQLDDRAGVYALMKLLPKLYGLEFDLLLTEGEEQG